MSTHRLFWGDKAMASLIKMIKWFGLRLIPAKVRRLIFRAAFSIMPDNQKDDIRREFHIASLECSLRNMKKLGFHPQRIVDIGAYVGGWTLMVTRIFPSAQFLMIEAQESKRGVLEGIAKQLPDAACKIALLGPTDRAPVSFFELETGSSVFDEESNVRRTVSIRETEMLDTVIEEAGLETVDFLKLDVQGYELEVLRGAKKTLPKVEAVLLEVSLIEINKGAPLLAEVVAFMKENSFRVYDICSFIRRPLDNAVWQTDVLFVRETSNLLSRRSFSDDAVADFD